MRALIALAIGLALASPSGATEAHDPFAGEALDSSALDSQRGGTLLMNNDTTQTALNQGNVTVEGYATKVSGTIREATVNGNHGITAVMQNTGDLVNMNNATSVNVFLQ